MKKSIYLVIIAILLVTIACQVIDRDDQKGRVFEGDDFSFTIPRGWKTVAEVWGKPMQEDKDYYGLGVTTAITIQYPPNKGEGKVFFSVASDEMDPMQELIERVQHAYEDPVTEIKDLTLQEISINGMDGYEVIYSRPWGEPWWNFRDVWVEHNDRVYVFSYHSTPGTFADYKEVADEIIKSIEFQK